MKAEGWPLTESHQDETLRHPSAARVVAGVAANHGSVSRARETRTATLLGKSPETSGCML